VDTRAEIRDFLTSRRARLTPEQVGLTVYGDKRRVPGLRRSEVAALAGVSIEYYTQLERGSLRSASEQVLEALAGALQLDEAERTHLFDLARAASSPSGSRSRGRASNLRPSIQRLLETQASPAYVRSAGMEILAANSLCTALYGDVLAPQALPLSLPRFVFLDPRAVELFLDWDAVADDIASSLRIQAGRTPNDRLLSDLVGELATRSDAFASRWARHNVRLHRTARKRLHNSLVGDLELTGDALQLPGEDLTLIVYTAPTGSPAQEKLDFLARWAGAAPTPDTPTSRSTARAQEG
jgi:transcriptional regulator with XRE-family HTH domain